MYLICGQPHPKHLLRYMLEVMKHILKKNPAKVNVLRPALNIRE